MFDSRNMGLGLLRRLVWYKLAICILNLLLLFQDYSRDRR
jgi:hypothetical protein